MLAESVRPLTHGSAGACNLDPAQYRHVPVPLRLVQVRMLCLAGLGCGCPPSGTDTNGPHQGEDPPVGSVGTIPNEQTPAAALSTATLQHTELVRITRNFGKSNFEIALDAWTPIENPREIVSQNDHVLVRIIEIDAERRRLSLSMKQVLPGDPVLAPISLIPGGDPFIDPDEPIAEPGGAPDLELDHVEEGEYDLEGLLPPGMAAEVAAAVAAEHAAKLAAAAAAEGAVVEAEVEAIVEEAIAEAEVEAIEEAIVEEVIAEADAEVPEA